LSVIIEQRIEFLKVLERTFQDSPSDWDRAYDAIEFYENGLLHAFCPICGWKSKGFTAPFSRLDYHSSLARLLARHLYAKHRFREFFDIWKAPTLWDKWGTFTAAKINWKCKKCGKQGESIPLMIAHFLVCQGVSR